jgi:hypothetical protein
VVSVLAVVVPVALAAVLMMVAVTAVLVLRRWRRRSEADGMVATG